MKRELGWEPTIRTPELVRIMVDADTNLLDDEQPGALYASTSDRLAQPKPGHCLSTNRPKSIVGLTFTGSSEFRVGEFPGGQDHA